VAHYIERNTNIAILQIRNEYRKFFSGLIYADLLVSMVLELQKKHVLSADIGSMIVNGQTTRSC